MSCCHSCCAARSEGVNRTVEGGERGKSCCLGPAAGTLCCHMLPAAGGNFKQHSLMSQTDQTWVFPVAVLHVCNQLRPVMAGSSQHGHGPHLLLQPPVHDALLGQEAGGCLPASCTAAV